MSSKKNNTLILQAVEGELMPEELTYQASLRSAIFDAVGAADVTEIVKGIVAKAKEGDPHSQKMFFDYVLGANTKPTAIHVTNNFQDVEQAGRLRRG